jgi:REP-associated tyrosine transposase
MSIPSRSDRTGTFFVTSATFNRRRLFQVAANSELFLETLQQYRREGHYKLHAFVVMPDHIHLLLTPQGITIERAVGLIKGGFSHRVGSKFPVWQRGFTDHRIRDRNEFEMRRNYIHQNPVRAGIVELCDSYPYSSAYRLGIK